MNLTRYEMETIVNYNEDSQLAMIYTASKPVMRRLEKLCEKYPDTYTRTGGDMYSATYTCPKDRIRFAPPPSEKRREASRANALRHGFGSSKHTAPEQ
jgi:hypothetical protein